MRISRELHDEIVTHSHDDLPDECCGLVAGRGGEATRVYRARNELASPFSYQVDSRDLLRITNEIDDAGEELLAIYHSHTKSPAEPSQTDINLAVNWPDPLYLICSLANREDPVVRAWEIRDGAVAEADYEVTG